MSIITPPTPTADCKCGHSVAHHDAGECWTTPGGRESTSVTCGCHGYEASETGAEDHMWAMTLEIAKHHRLDPMTENDRCTCGHKTTLGRMFTEHIAQGLVAQGWRKP